MAVSGTYDFNLDIDEVIQEKIDVYGDFYDLYIDLDLEDWIEDEIDDVCDKVDSQGASNKDIDSLRTLSFASGVGGLTVCLVLV